jgi:4-diphosphocytidyl-2-C-methyl-D-erythritol kinase
VSHSITRLAPAKVNLALRVLAREASGYHQIETVFQKLALADQVTLRVTAGSRSLDIQWDGPRAADLGPTEQNLAWRAAEAFASATGGPAGWEIQLTKRIPAGGGLGGGSADAAAVLLGLNQLTGSPLSAELLRQLAATLGSDVPFLAQPAALALGTGRGDVLQPLPSLPPAPVLVVLPPFGVNTAQAYGALAAARQAAGRPAPVAKYTTADWDRWEAVAARQINDFEPTVFAEHPELAAVRALLAAAGARVARMSGSGSTLFGVWGPGAVLPEIELPAGWLRVATETQ